MRERIAVFLCEFLFFYRAENLCYQFGHGQELKPQFRKIVCLVCACFARKRINENLFEAYSYTDVQLRRRNASRNSARVLVW